MRKHIFIEPFWKGPEGAAAWAHLYTKKEVDAPVMEFEKKEEE